MGGLEVLLWELLGSRRIPVFDLSQQYFLAHVPPVEDRQSEGLECDHTLRWACARQCPSVNKSFLLENEKYKEKAQVQHEKPPGEELGGWVASASEAVGPCPVQRAGSSLSSCARR